VCPERLLLECDVPLFALLTLGRWDDLPEYDRLLELLVLEAPLRLLPELDDLLECDELLECEDPLECDDPLEEWEEPDDLLEDDDLDLSPLRDANEASGTRIHRVRPANLRAEFLSGNSIAPSPGVLIVNLLGYRSVFDEPPGEKTIL